MKNIILFLISISIFSCEGNSATKFEEKDFDVNDLSKLNIEQYDNFWNGEEILGASDYITAEFNRHSNFIAGIRYGSGTKKIEISVFKARKDAISAMEERIQSVACIIVKGDTKSFSCKDWWYSSCIPNYVFINQWNTIIEVTSQNQNFDEVKKFLMDSSLEIANRVDSLSK